MLSQETNHLSVTFPIMIDGFQQAIVLVMSLIYLAYLSKAALVGFFRLMSSWQVKDEDARELLGGLSSSSFYEWKKNPDRLLEVDRITRVSYLLGIYSGLTFMVAWPYVKDLVRGIPWGQASDGGQWMYVWLDK